MRAEQAAPEVPVQAWALALADAVRVLSRAQSPQERVLAPGLALARGPAAQAAAARA